MVGPFESLFLIHGTCQFCHTIRMVYDLRPLNPPPGVALFMCVDCFDMVDEASDRQAQEWRQRGTTLEEAIIESGFELADFSW